MNKAALRSVLLARRTEVHSDQAAARLADVALGAGIEFGAVVAGYWPIRGEIDPRPLMARLKEKGHRIVLPRCATRNAPATFHVVEDKQPTETDAWGVPAPRESAPAHRPDALLVPMLGFDTKGGRLGYGAGVYDKTIAALREKGPLLVLGLAFAAQEVEDLPIEPHDVRMDWIVTENGVAVAPKDQ